MVSQSALQIRCWADGFGLESGVITEGSCSLFLYYEYNQKHAATLSATLLLLTI